MTQKTLGRIVEAALVTLLATALLALLLAGLAGGGGEQPLYAAPQLTGENGVRDVITPTNMAATGVAQSLGAASGDGHKFTNTGKDFIIVANGYTSTITLTVVTGGTAGGFAIADVDVAVTAGQTKLIGPFETSIFNQTSGSNAGKVYLNWDAAVTGTVASSVTLAVYRLQ